MPALPTLLAVRNFYVYRDDLVSSRFSLPAADPHVAAVVRRKGDQAVHVPRREDVLKLGAPFQAAKHDDAHEIKSPFSPLAFANMYDYHTYR